MEDTASQDLQSPLAHQRTQFAKYRTQLALDRATLPWLRTALTFATFGFGMSASFARSSKGPIHPNPKECIKPPSIWVWP